MMQMGGSVLEKSDTVVDYVHSAVSGTVHR